MLDTQANTPRSTGLNRRDLLGAAVWTTLVIAVAVAAPAQATSTVEYRPFSGSHIVLTTEDIDQQGTVDGVPTFALQGEPDNPVVYFGASVDGLQATLTSYTVTYELPFAVDWDVVDQDWSMIESEPVDGYYTYTLTPLALPAGRIDMERPLSTGQPWAADETNSVAAPQFHGTARDGTWSVGGTRPFQVSSVKHYDFIAHLPTGDVVDSFHRERVTGGV
ncbi:hypothetical protein HDC34_001059 [Pseudoclavibacter sp. JAI123]|uniref:hypothetical protein n=1 Tax=Pseudoclavibacter sp. JAI123 TaxID=2723065 RepID=UPI0015C780A4|nr:hypothetical protein [Pseudoclavibacter sp. JAI123]NYF12765.1 hypothetical protein [Pseudoclavibacter sp. JAI123]